MKKLLEDLKKLDAECYEEIERGLEQVDIEYEEDIIQGACQRRIATEGWSLEQNATIRDDGKIIYIAFITLYEMVKVYPHLGLGSVEPLSEDGSHLVRRHKDKIGRYGDSSARAILAAYIEVIRSQPCHP